MTERVECDGCGKKVNVRQDDTLAEHHWTRRGVKHRCDRSGTVYARHAATFFCVGTPHVDRQWVIQCRCGQEWLLDATVARSVDEVEAPWREHLTKINNDPSNNTTHRTVESTR